MRWVIGMDFDGVKCSLYKVKFLNNMVECWIIVGFCEEMCLKKSEMDNFLMMVKC